MKRFRLSIPLAALLLAAAQAAPQSKNIHEDVDPYSGLRSLYLEVSTHTCPGDPSAGLGDPQIHLLFVATQNDNRTISYFITPELDRGDYTLGLHPRDTMDALIDGAVFNFGTYAGSTTVKRQWIDHSYPHASIPFGVAQADLDRLSRAQTFQFRINGPRHAMQRCTDAKRMRDLGEFLDAAKAYGMPEFTYDPKLMPIMETVNPSDRHKTLTLDNIATQPCPGEPALGPRDPDVHLAISANQRSDGGVWYFISTELENGATLGLPKGTKLHTQINGVSGSANALSGSVLATRSGPNGQPIWHETTAFHVHQTDLIAITKAPFLEIRISGPSGELHRCATADQFIHLGEFIGIAAGYEFSHLASR